MAWFLTLGGLGLIALVIAGIIFFNSKWGMRILIIIAIMDGMAMFATDVGQNALTIIQFGVTNHQVADVTGMSWVGNFVTFVAAAAMTWVSWRWGKDKAAVLVSLICGILLGMAGFSMVINKIIGFFQKLAGNGTTTVPVPGDGTNPGNGDIPAPTYNSLEPLRHAASQAMALADHATSHLHLAAVTVTDTAGMALHGLSAMIGF